MIHFDNLTYRYPEEPQPVLANVTLDIDQQEFVLVTGPSGSGKSTLLRCLNGLVPHFTGGTLTGEVSVAGHDPVAQGPQVLSQVVGFVFQDPESQFVVDLVEDEIAFALENQAVPPREMRFRVEETLDLLDLAPLRDRPVNALSGGEKQRVAIAAALALRPRILVLDEPTSQLDPRSAEEVLESLVRLNRDLGLTIVLAEHRLERVLPHVDRLVYLPDLGQLALSGPPRQVLRQVDLTPPLVTLAKSLGWEPLPLTVKEGRALAAELSVPAQRAEVQPQQQEAPMLQVEDVSFSYNGASALDGLDLRVGSGEIVALMGRNGSGKTTLLKCIVGLLRPSDGKIDLGSRPLIGQPTVDIAKQVGYLPQNPNDLLFADTVAEELQVTLRNHDLLETPPTSPQHLLRRLGLADVAGAYPRDLSVGQRQRTALGAVTVTRPRLLLLDEPTRGMDYAAKDELVHLLEEWQAEGTGILLVTHDVELAAQAADRVVVLSQGRVIAEGCPETVLTASHLFAPQISRLFPGTGWLTAEHALAGLRKQAAR
ncbi:MAG: energy-coupling factor transporter ATPase [Anaerolineae bacterium]|jgi:energy-coupling factor transport system ATP-binding protein